MRDSYDVCAIGGGPDALVAAAYLAARGRTVLVVGERGRPGGIAANVEIAPGFTFPVAPETLPSVDPAVAADLRLALRWTAPDPVLTVVGEGDPLPIPRGLPTHPEFAAELRSLAGFLRKLLERPPLDLDATLPDALPAALAALGLGGRRLHTLLRSLPMSLANFLRDFDDPRLRAGLAGPALTGIRLGPRDPGTAGLFLHFHSFGHPEPLGWIRPPDGGATEVGRALRDAARGEGARLDSSGARRIVVAGGRATGVELLDGRTIRCGTVVSDAAPGATLLRWAGERNLPPTFASDVRRIRYRGTAARVGFALSAPPGPPGLYQVGGSLEALERSADAFKYGRLADPPLVLASVGETIVAATVQSVPADANEADVAEATLAALERAFPRIRGLVTASRVLTPSALERGFGLLEGSFHQGEPAMDQLWSLRPVPGYARHRTPIDGLFLAGPGTYPYGGLHGVSGRNAAAEMSA